jgi:predicted small integral membrane protein
MTSFWTWLSIIGLSMTPNLVLGPSMAVGVGIAAHYDPLLLLPVVAAAGYIEGLVVAWLAGASTHIGFIDRWVVRRRTPRSVELANKWGVWGGLTIGCAVVGQEPILVALRWLGVDMQRLWLPLAFSNAVFAVIYYVVVSVSLDQVANF